MRSLCLDSRLRVHLRGHVSGRCNAFDATRFGAAVSAEKFDLSKLLDFARNGYTPEPGFREWVRSGEEKILRELESL